MATCIDYPPPHYLVAGTHRRPAHAHTCRVVLTSKFRYTMYIHPSILPLLFFFSSRSPFFFFFFFSRVAAGINHNSFSFRMHCIYVLGLYILLSSVTAISHFTLLFLHHPAWFLLHPFNSSLLHPIQFLFNLNLDFMHPTLEFITPSPSYLFSHISLVRPSSSHNLYVHVTKPPVCKNVETNLNGHPRQEIMYICTNHRFISILEERKHL